MSFCLTFRFCPCRHQYRPGHKLASANGRAQNLLFCDLQTSVFNKEAGSFGSSRNREAFSLRLPFNRDVNGTYSHNLSQIGAVNNLGSMTGSTKGRRLDAPSKHWFTTSFLKVLENYQLTVFRWCSDGGRFGVTRTTQTA